MEMEGTICQLCYTNKVVEETKLKCGFMVCGPCMINWIKLKVHPEFINGIKLSGELTHFNNDLEKIACVNYQWAQSNNILVNTPMHQLTYDECFEFFRNCGSKELQEEFTMIMLNTVAIHGVDFRKCPTYGCDYIGIIDLKPCHEQLECGKCGTRWSDPALYPIMKRLCGGFSLDSEILNNIQKIIKGEPCPNCGICIIKMSGCDHMVWAKCNYEFCWACLGHYPGYVHSQNTFCPIRRVIIYFFVYFFLIYSINDKICSIWPFMDRLEDVVLGSIWKFIIANIYFASAFLWLTAFGEMMNTRNLIRMYPEYASTYRWTLWTTTIITIFYPFAYSYITYQLYITSDYFRDWARIIFVEVVIGLWIFMIYMSFLFIGTCLQYHGFFKRNNQYIANNNYQEVNYVYDLCESWRRFLLQTIHSIHTRFQR